MSKFLKIVLILCIFISFCATVCFATDDEEDVPTDTSYATTQAATVTSVTNLNNLPEANLGLNNILNVLLIAIGFLLILFAIAILIRLKKE